MNWVCPSALRRFTARHQPTVTPTTVIKAGIGGAVAIGSAALLTYLTGNPWLMAPFGATCVLLFSVPASPLSQPANVIGGHVVSTAIGLLVHTLMPVEWWSLGLSVGLAIAAMAALRLTHPPAGADPLVVLFESPDWLVLIFPVALGSALLIAIAWVVHRIPPRTTYPSVPVSLDRK